MPRYLYLNRPPGIGCQPDGFTEFKAYWPQREVDGVYCLGWVEYAEPLTYRQIRKWDFMPADPVEAAIYRLARLEFGSDVLREYWELSDADLDRYAITEVLIDAIPALKAAGLTFEQVIDRMGGE